MPIGRTCLRGISTSLDASGKRVGRLDTFRICHMSGGENLDATERPVIAATRTTKRRGPRLSRADRTPLGLWLRKIDRVLLLLVPIPVDVGLLAVAASSPATGRAARVEAVWLYV